MLHFLNRAYDLVDVVLQVVELILDRLAANGALLEADELVILEALHHNCEADSSTELVFLQIQLTNVTEVECQSCVMAAEETLLEALTAEQRR